MIFRLKSIKQMIFVGTCPRSGSSLLAGCLDRCGAFGGKTLGRTKGNIKGQYENRAIGITCFAPALESVRTNPRELLKLARRKRVPSIPNLKRDITYILNTQGYEGGPAYYKGGPFTFVYDEIYKHFPDAVWLLPKRTPACIHASMIEIYEDRGDGFYSEISSYHRMQDLIERRSSRAYTVDMERVVAGDFGELKPLIEKIGLTWNEDAIREWVDPDLWHHKGN